ncbi:MAG: DUF4149 domain-containing protein [Woeseiaceae bacterium]
MYQISEKIILTLWIGSMWAIGYIVAPVLFQMLDKAVAGNIAGQLFSIVSYLGIFSSIALFFKCVMQFGFSKGYWQIWVLLSMFVLILIGQFILQPMMAELKASGITVTNKSEFGRLHGIASILFLVNSLAGLSLVITGLSKKS